MVGLDVRNCPQGVNKTRGWSNGYLDPKHAKGWIICHPSAIKNEGCWNHPNQTNPISKWCSRKYQVVLVLKKASRKQHMFY